MRVDGVLFVRQLEKGSVEEGLTVSDVSLFPLGHDPAMTHVSLPPLSSLPRLYYFLLNTLTTRTL